MQAPSRFPLFLCYLTLLIFGVPDVKITDIQQKSWKEVMIAQRMEG